MPDPFGGRDLLSHRMDPFFDDGFGFGGLGDIGHAFHGIDKQMERMRESFDQPMAAMAPGGEGQSESFSSSFSSSQGADGKVHQKSSKTGSETKCHNGVCKVVTCADGKCKETNQKADVLAKETVKSAQEHPHRHHRSPFAGMAGMFGGMPDPTPSFRKEM